MSCIGCLPPHARRRRRVSSSTAEAPAPAIHGTPRDPISILSAIAIGLHSINKLYDLVESIRDSPREIQNVSADSRSICETLEALGRFLKDEKDSDLPSEIIQSLHIPLDNTRWAADGLIDTIKPFVSEKGELRKAKWMGMKWSYYQKDIKQLGAQLCNAKSTLNMTLAVVNVVKTSHIKNDTTEIIHYLKQLNLAPTSGQGDPPVHKAADQAESQWSDPRMKNINFAMTRFLDTASTAADSPKHSPWDSSTDVAQVSAFKEDFYDDDIPILAQAPVMTREASEAKIHNMLSKEPTHASVNEDGQTALHLAAMEDEYLTQEVLARASNIPIEIDVRNWEGETPLMCAINAGNAETVRLLLKNHADVNATDNKQSTPLHLAALNDKSGTMIQLLLRGNADTELRDELGLTPLFVAAFHGNDAAARCLVEHGAKHQAKETDGFTALHYATMHPNHTFMARLLNAKGPDFEAFYDLSTYNLSIQPSSDTAAKRRSLIVRTLLEHGADIEACSQGFTPLHIAAVTAQEPVVNALLENGASAKGATVICAYWGLLTSTVKLLLEKGADIGVTDMRWNKPALTWTAELGSPSTLEVLLQHGANVQHRDAHASALHYASGNARTECVKLLLGSGSADLGLRDHQHKTPLLRVTAGSSRYFLAGRWWTPTSDDRKDTAVLLLDAGSNAAAKDIWGRAAIHYAATYGYLGALKAIVERGGDPDILDEKGHTPLDRAQESGNVDVVTYLKRQKHMKKLAEATKEERA